MTISISYSLLPGATAPTRATPGSAGLDLHAYLPYGGPLVLPPGERARIATGLHLAIPPGYEGQVRPRSGLAWEHGLTILNSPGTIDADYRGEIRVLVINHGARDIVIRNGDRIAQLVVTPVLEVDLVPTSVLPPTARGSGGFGSTGTEPMQPLVRFIVYDPRKGVTFCDTEDKARKMFEVMVAELQTNTADHTWLENAEAACWGRIHVRQSFTPAGSAPEDCVEAEVAKGMEREFLEKQR